MTNSFEQMLSHARRLFHERKYPESTVIFNQLCDRDPHNGSLLIAAARVCSLAYDYAGVQQRFAQLESLLNLSCDHWLAMAQISQWLRRDEWATKYFEKAITTANSSAGASAAYAMFMEHANNLDKADDLVASGLRIDPGSAACQLAKAKLLRRHKEFDAAQAWINDLLRNPAARMDTQISAGYEMAQLCDAQGDCEGAMAALVKAKQLTRSVPEFPRLVTEAIAAEKDHDRILRLANAEYFKMASSWQPPHSYRIALLGGHPRSGTTLLEQALDANSNVVSAEETSIFFDTVLSKLEINSIAHDKVDARLERWRGDYFHRMESVLRQPLSGRMLLDKNPSLTNAIPVIARVFPECRYIIALRDPRDVVLSWYFSYIPITKVSVSCQSLAETARRYVRSMAMWLACRQFLDKSKWIEARYESMVTDPSGETQKIMQMLEMDYQTAQSKPELHARGKVVFSPTYADVIQPVHQRAVGRWKRYERWFGEAINVLESTMAALGY